MQPSSASIVKSSTTCVPSIVVVLTAGPDAITQSTGITTTIYQIFICQTHLTAD